MPKRIPTPEPGDDEPKYFTVVQPYPLNANWELPNDYITFGRWIACCVGPEPFFALFYKPSARGQVILEISRDYPHPERLLGEHRWSEFLQNPNVEEAGRVTQIFYSTYSTGRQAQKDGWKRINVADSWFKNWSPQNPVIRHPYPPTLWCPLPPEDRTNKPMCRPLPVSVKAPPPPAAAPAPVVPGSANWVSQKGAPPKNTPAALRGAWAQRSSAAHVAPKTVKSIPATSTAPWHMPTAPKSSHTVAVPTNKYPAVPPGLGLRPGEPDISSPPGLSRSTTSASSSSIDSALPSIASTQYDHVRDVMDGFVHISISPSQEARLYKEDVEVSPDPNAYVAEWEKMPIADVDTLWPTAGQVDTGENLWGDSDDIEQKKKKQSEILCTVHGIICKKGICQEYAKLLREKERAERDGARGGSAKGKGKSSPHCGVRY
ncbi:hypothetical protein GGX14DRAFT_443565 [Mycena pura]|uniref:Uncharacterized protein n=1 Tax=Mycena pura TaxID=153505 RepID=A0AAD6YDD0_9AGAR|nr:hypothetical protein GGX14DRAFT_443565 [Mycena pura]